MNIRDGIFPFIQHIKAFILLKEHVLLVNFCCFRLFNVAGLLLPDSALVYRPRASVDFTIIFRLKTELKPDE